jgi:hypothetical protein
MKKRIALVAVVSALLAATPCMAESPKAEFWNWASPCPLTGSWYGGGLDSPDQPGFKYVLDITSSRDGRHSVIAWGAYSTSDLGFAVSTPWTGEIVSRRSGGLEIFLINLNNSDGAFPPTEYPVVQAVRGTVSVVDCTTITIEYTFFGIYLWGQTPFIDEPVDTIPVPIIETHHRMPTGCPACGSVN